MSEERPKHVVILGGGSAGWMAAALLAHHWIPKGTRITLVESAEIGIIGVGEGSTPQLKHFFDVLGIAESAWMPRCSATYKTGIEFRGWSDVPGYESYFHPFPTDLDGFTAHEFIEACLLRRAGRDVPAHPDPYFLPTRLAKDRRAPLSPPNFPFDITYGYHFDAVLLGQFLSEHSIGLGVRHVDARIAAVDVDGDGRIRALVGDDGSRVEADFFVDASGFRAAIIEAGLGVERLSFHTNLFNDRAVVTPTAAEANPRPCTTATALSAGWAWHIPLTNRVGNGYVYSSRFVDDQAARSELLTHLGLPDETETRTLSMRVGRSAQSWASNCLAIGLAQGFIEPLEATALHIVMAAVDGFIEAVEQGGQTERTRAAFNERINRRYEGIRDYIVSHYRAARRSDSDYWRACTSIDALSDSVRRLFTCWFTAGDMVAEIERQQIAAYYAPVSWHCLFGGYGNFPDSSSLRPLEPGLRVPDRGRAEGFISGCALNFQTHADALEKLI